MKRLLLSSFVASCALAISLPAQPLTGLQLWLKADAITGLNHGDKVAAWSDASGTGNHATNPVVASQPIFATNALNGLPTVRFADGGNVANAGQYLDSTAAINANRTPLTILIVFKSDVSATARDTLLQPLDAGANAGRTLLYLQNDPAYDYRVWTASSQGGGPAATAYRPSSWTLVTMAQEPVSGVVTFWRDGQPDGTTAMGPNTQPNGLLRIGDNKARAAGLQGDIAEILIYDSVLSATDRAAAETYLLTKYALAPSSIVNSFRDNFNVSAQSNDVNFENTLGRQSGSAGALNYLENTSGASDALSQINNAAAPGQLRLEVNGTQVYTAVTPNHNFTEGGGFSIDFDLDAGVNDPGGLNSDWACVVFGATSPLAFVNGSDGMGILFRNNGEIQVFDGSTATGGGALLPLGQIHVHIEATTAGFQGSPATVRMFVNGTQVQLGAGSLEYTKTTGFRGNLITLGCYAATGNTWVNTFDNLMVCATQCIRPATTVLTSYPGQTNQSVTINVPASLNATGAVSVVVSSSNPAVAEPTGAVAGLLSLDFPPGTTTRSFNVTAYQRGTAVFSLSTLSGGCVQDSVAVNVGASLVRNPSFEENGQGGVGYGPIAGWSGPSGVNGAGQPFADNGVFPDRGQVAFMQGSGTLQQNISGLVPGQTHWLQFRYNVRNCCGGTMNLAVRFAGAELAAINSIQAVGSSNPYRSRSISFVPASDSGALEFVASAAGDASLLLDAITILTRDTNQFHLWNPSFEASGDVPTPGIVTPGNISGWISAGTIGINRSGQDFADNSVNPDQDHVAVIKGPSSLSQTISNLSVGTPYELVYSYTAGSSGFPAFRVTWGGAVLLEDYPSALNPGDPYYRVTNEWVATSTTAELKFEQFDPDANAVILLDDVQIIGQALPPCETTLSTDTYAMFSGQPIGSNLVYVSLPLYLILTQAVDITITSTDPTIAIPTGAPGGTLVLHLDAGLTNWVSFAVTALRSGTTTFTITNSFGCPGATLLVKNRSALVENPSFEDNSTDAWPGYFGIASWKALGGSGLNPITVAHPNGSSPFADNGAIPDRSQVAFLQNAGELSQVITGLDTNKQYWLQASVNARNCCGAMPNASVAFNGVALAPPTPVPPVGGANPYYVVSVPFVPNSPTGAIAIISHPITPDGDRTLLIDAVTLVQRDSGQIVIQNPSFEASGVTPFPGVVSPALIAGWIGSGTYGVNLGGGPFADNGLVPDQDNVAILQGENSSLSQTVGGLIAGSLYRLSYAYNARTGNLPQLQVSVDDVVLHNEAVSPVGGSAAYRSTNITFVASSNAAVFTFRQAAAGDQTVLLDDLKLVLDAPPQVMLTLQRFGDDAVRLSWPTSAGAAWVLQNSATAQPGSWSDSSQPVGTEGDEFVVYESATPSRQFFQLIRR